MHDAVHDRRGDAHLLADPHQARQRLAEPEHAGAFTRPARAPAMRAASSRRRSTASVAEAVALDIAERHGSRSGESDIALQRNP